MYKHIISLFIKATTIWNPCPKWLNTIAVAITLSSVLLFCKKYTYSFKRNICKELTYFYCFILPCFREIVCLSYINNIPRFRKLFLVSWIFHDSPNLSPFCRYELL